jgi:hypothetical protein
MQKAKDTCQLPINVCDITAGDECVWQLAHYILPNTIPYAKRGHLCLKNVHNYKLHMVKIVLLYIHTQGTYTHYSTNNTIPYSSILSSWGRGGNGWCQLTLSWPHFSNIAKFLSYIFTNYFWLKTWNSLND